MTDNKLEAIQVFMTIYKNKIIFLQKSTFEVRIFFQIYTVFFNIVFENFTRQL